MYSSSGSATVNDKQVTAETPIRPGDTLRTGKDSEIVFVVSDCSMLLHADSHVVLEGVKGAASARLVSLKLLGGRLLSVYPPGPVRIQTVTATAQILGNRRLCRGRSGADLFLHVFWRHDRIGE